MSDKTKIEWCDATWNPVTGCTPVSEGCENCYAKRLVKRFPHVHGEKCVPDLDYGGLEYEPRHFDQITLHTDRLEIPLHWRKPRRIFVCSTGDLFHEQVPDHFVSAVWATMFEANWHTYMILTKRAQRMARLYQRICPTVEDRHYMNHVWFGVTAENQARADERIPILLQTPAAVRFVSLEPLLGPVDLGPWTWQPAEQARAINRSIDYTLAMGGSEPDDDFGPALPGPKLDWVIVGSETGPGARPMNPDWARSIRDQCKAAGVPFFMKKMSKNAPIPGDLMIREFPSLTDREGKK